MVEPNIEEIARLLNTERERNGNLPELVRIAWDAYLKEIYVNQFALDLAEFEKISNEFGFPNFDNDPDANDPVLAMSIGKHNKRDPNIPPGGFVHQTKLEELVNDLEDELAHFGGLLPCGYTVALSARFLGLRDCKEITDLEYQQLLAMLPVLEDNPVKKVEEFTRRYAEV